MNNKCIKILEDTLLAVSAAIVGLDLIFIFGAVVGRFFGLAFSFLEEFPRLLSSLIAFLGVAGLLRGGRHVNVELLPTRLKGRALARLEIVLFLSCAAAATFLVIASADAMLYLRQLGEMTVSEIAIPIWWIYVSQVAGFALLLFVSLELTITRIYFLFSDKEETG